MKKIKKWEAIAMLDVFKEKGCKTLEEAIEILNKEIKYDTDVVFEFNRIKEK